MNPEPRPSEDCEACLDYKKEGYKECYCHCHTAGNYLVGSHHHFNYVPDEKLS